MKQTLGRLAVLAALVVGIVAMADLTQNRPDPAVPGSSTTIDFSVSTRDFSRGEPAAAAALWAVCASTVDGDVSPVPEAIDGGRWRVSVTPAIGEHGENRLVGCIEDVTIDRVVGDVIDLRAAA